jgi:hypothetical protein
MPGLRRSSLIFATILAASAVRGADPSLSPYAAVDVAPVSTWAYFQNINLAVGRFLRDGETYSAAYTAKVFPCFFYNEHGSLRIKVPDSALRQLASGNAFDFKGSAVRDDGKERPVDGRVTPIDAGTGRIRVRLFYSHHIVVVFTTTYRLPDAGPVPAARNGGQSQ